MQLVFIYPQFTTSNGLSIKCMSTEKIDGFINPPQTTATTDEAAPTNDSKQNRGTQKYLTYFHVLVLNYNG